MVDISRFLVGSSVFNWASGFTTYVHVLEILIEFSHMALFCSTERPSPTIYIGEFFGGPTAYRIPAWFWQMETLISGYVRRCMSQFDFRGSSKNSGYAGVNTQTNMQKPWFIFMTYVHSEFSTHKRLQEGSNPWFFR